MAQTQAWTYAKPGYPESLHLTTQQLPTPLAPTQLLVRTRAVALNPVDIQLMNMPIWHLPFYPFSGEKGMCADFAGSVISSGAESGFKEDDEVFGISFAPGTGVLAEVTAVDTAKAVVLKKPSALSWEQAAALPLVWLTARTTIEKVAEIVEKGPQKKVVVLGGSSGVGMYAVHLAKKRGWKVLASCSGKNVEFVKSMGADVIVDYTQQSVPEAVRDFAPDSIIDCVGGTECLYLAKRYITIVGDKTTRTAMGGAAIYLWNPQKVIRSLLGYFGLSQFSYACVNLQMKKEWLEETLQLPTEKIAVDSTFPFNETKDALERLNTGRARGKVVIKVPS